MRHPSLVDLSLGDALHLALRLSGKTAEEVGAQMGWTPGNTSRIFGAENYWPTLPNIPKLCVVLGNYVLIDWIREQAEAGGLKHDFDALDSPRLLQEYGQLFRDLGDMAKAGEHALADGHINNCDAKTLIRKLYILCRDVVRIIRGLRPIAGQVGRDMQEDDARV
jgi:hypothetical protein